MSVLRVLNPIRPHIRRLLNVDTEYKLRRSLYRLIPSQNPAPGVHLMHCCSWKTASQWIRLILSDPRLYRYHGHVPYLARYTPPAEQLARQGAMMTSLYWGAERFVEFRGQVKGARAFVVVRDPRDLLVSWYFSNRYSHDPMPGLSELSDRRARMEGMDEESAINQTIDEFGVVADLLTSWANFDRTDPDVVLFKYEDLTAKDNLPLWRSIMSHYGLEVPDAVIARLLDFYAFNNLKSAKRSGSEVGKYRSGRAGDWRTLMTARNYDHFQSRFGGLATGLGYSAD